jgi:hypothetical protein
MPRPAVIHLHVAGPEPAAVAGRIRVLHLAVEQVGHGLEAAVRMIGRADRLARPVIRRSHLVEQQERVGMAQTRAGERPSHDEAAALALAMRGHDFGDLTGVAGLSCHRTVILEGTLSLSVIIESQRRRSVVS